MTIDKTTIGISIVGLIITAYVIYSEVSRISGTNSDSDEDDETKKD